MIANKEKELDEKENRVEALEKEVEKMERDMEQREQHKQSLIRSATTKNHNSVINRSHDVK